MKKNYLLALCLFISVFAFSQNIVFEDAVLKNYLVSEAVADMNGDGIADELIDANNDGEISTAEALLVKGIMVEIDPLADISEKITSFDEISYFENIVSIDLKNHDIESMDLSNNLSLTTILLMANYHETLILPDTDGLENLSIYGSELTSIDVSNYPNLKQLDLAWTPITSVDVTNNLLLEGLNIGQCYNINTEVDLSNNVNLQYLDVSNYAFSNIDLTLYPDLETLYFNETLLTEFDFSSNLELKHLYISGDNLSELNIENNINLEVLRISKGTNIENLNISNNINLKEIGVQNTEVSYLDFSESLDLTSLTLSNNKFENILLNKYTNLNFLYVANEPALKILTLNSENIQTYDGNFSNLSMIEYVCMPESLISTYEPTLVLYSPDVIVNSFCTFSPWETDYTIKGNVTYAGDGNCDNASGIYNMSLEIASGDVSAVFSLNSDEAYEIPLGAGTYTLKPLLENEEYFNVTPESIEITFPNEDNLDEIIQDFCVTPNGEISDVEITLIPTSLARPGFDSGYKIVYKNIGNQIISGDIDFTFDDTIIDFVNSNPTEEEINTGSISWTFDDLVPFESRSIYFTLNLNSPQEDPALIGGEFLNLLVDLDFMESDDQVGGDSFALKQEVVNSYDPNDKTCLEGDTMRPELVGEYLTYRIRFENTGTASAVNIVVEDEINPAMFDISTIQLIDASHNCEMRTEGNTAKFFFDDIMLSHEDEINDGYVIFKIKTLDTLELEDTIENTAEIYFDFNDAIVTNTAITTVKNLDVDSYGTDSSIAIYPNPATEILNISSINEIEKVEIYSVLGKQVAEYKFDSTKQSEKMNIKTLETGVYLLKVNTSVGEKQLKLVIE
ncbi:T9SS type A sorting domain-containing protein [Aureivirga sp. CE67]|uniref:T9SS type A sorting domain-containing protein n=1 Tax=Aureivirga sp. CE67 TaxID=1788983 RepID=UPI0018CBA056|nr:T9SS type A sorting domain-containing protein [Aureivirga sp. CE67]